MCSHRKHPQLHYQLRNLDEAKTAIKEGLLLDDGNLSLHALMKRIKEAEKEAEAKQREYGVGLWTAAYNSLASGATGCTNG